MAGRFVAGEISQSLAVDVNALSSLKRQAGAAPKEALSKAASQFEAMFLQMLLKSMRESLPKDGPFASEAATTYVGMFDQQIAQKLADKGMGLAKLIEKQLLPRIAGSADAAAGAKAGTDRLPAQGARADGAAALAAALRSGVASAATGRAPAAVAGNGTVAGNGAAAGGVAAPGGSGPAGAARTVSAAAGAAKTAVAASSVPDTVRQFVDHMRPYAEAAAKAIGVPAQLLLAQAGLETGWGRHQPRAADGASSHNLFGIKSSPGWSGAAVAAATTEYVAGAAVKVAEKFRSYGSYTEAFQDFGRLIRDNSRYAAAYASVGDPAAYAKALQKGGYATDPQYADKLMRAFRLVSTHVATSGAPTPVLAAAGSGAGQGGPAPAGASAQVLAGSAVIDTDPA